MKTCVICKTECSDNDKNCAACGASLVVESSTTGQLNKDTVLGDRYIVVRTLGQGGMGAVYQALDTRLNNTPVAIKEMSTQAVRGNLQGAIAAFKKEASMLISLRHHALPRIMDFFAQGEDRWYLVMDYIDGETLKEITDRRGLIPEAEVLDWAVQLSEILDYLHIQEPPIIFRDLKPSNIMLTPSGQIKLIDFGIARHFQQGNKTDTAAYGSSGFAPPEQYGENQTDARADIYAFGATMHYLLTGKDPSSTPFMFQPPGQLVKVSPAFETIIMRCLELNVEKRPTSVMDMLLILKADGSAVIKETSEFKTDKNASNASLLDVTIGLLGNEDKNWDESSTATTKMDRSATENDLSFRERSANIESNSSENSDFETIPLRSKNEKIIETNRVFINTYDTVSRSPERPKDNKNVLIIGGVLFVWIIILAGIIMFSVK